VDTEAPNDVSTRFEPAPGAANIEAAIGYDTVKRSVVVGPLLIVFFWIVGGWRGGLSAAGGVAVVVANFVLAGLILSRAAAISLTLYHAAALFGFFLRLALITLVMLVIANLVEVDRMAMGMAAIVSYLVLLSWEAVAVSRGKTKELEWS
jgi:hypothetical protein